MDCKFCKGSCRKAGRQNNGRQRYYCRGCKKYQQGDYRYAAYQPGIVTMIPKLVKESVSIRGIGRILRIALATVAKKVKAIADAIQKPPVPMKRNAFEPDEIRTYIKRKENQYWIAYALCSETKRVVDFVVH